MVAMSLISFPSEFLEEGIPLGCDLAAAEDFVAWAAKFAAENNMEITVTLSEDPANVSETMKQYL